MTELEAARREERDFLLASLDDLDAEYEAGDLDEADYLALKSDYTTRAAQAIRGVERATPPQADAPRGSWKTTAMWTVLIVVVAGLAGVWIAEFSGSRGTGTITGDTRETTRQRLFEATELLGSDPDAALELYDSVLIDEPSNAEALAYRGWLTNLQGDPATAGEYLESAVLSDPEYPDARVFATAVALNNGDVAAADGHLDALDQLDVPPFIEQLVRGQGLREGVVEAQLQVDSETPFVDSGLTVAEVARAADAFLDRGSAQQGLALHTAVLAELPDDVEALTEAGWYYGRLGFVGGAELAALLDTAHEFLTDAIEIDGTEPAPYVYRTFVNLWREDPAAGEADLVAYGELDAERDDLDLLISETGLREALIEAAAAP